MIVEHDRDVAIITMDHEPRHALRSDHCRELAAELRRLDADVDVGAIVLTGSDGVFSAGADLSWLLDQPADAVADYAVALDELFLAPAAGSTPVVAAVTGHAIAGGAVLVAACHLAVGTSDPRARFGLTELMVGVPIPPGAYAVCRRRFGRDLGRLLLGADLADGATAAAFGMFDEVVPPDEVLDTAREHAHRLASLPRATVELTLAQLDAAVHASLASLPPRHGEDLTAAWASDEARAAIATFVADRLR